MNNGRKIIRKRLVEILQDAAEDLGVNENAIFSNRTQEVVAKTGLPCIIVNTKNEDVTRMPVNASFREYELQLPVQIDCIVETNGPIEDVLDDFMDAILSELLKHELDQYNDTTPAWGDILYQSSDQKLYEEANKTIGVGSITLNVIYQAESSIIELDDYEGSDVEYNLAVSYTGSEGTAAAEDDVDMPE